MSETSLNTGEMLFQLRVWDYLAWALDDKRPLSVSLSVWDKFETLLPAKPSMECVDSGTRMFIRFTLGELAGMLNSGLPLGGGR